MPKRLVFSTSGISSSARITATACGARTSTIGRPCEDLLDLGGRAERREPAGVNQRDAMAALRFVEIVRRHEHRHAFLRERVDETPELAARQRIDAARRLVEEEDRRLVEDGAAEREALPPPAGEVARERLLAAGQAGHLEHEAPPRRQPLATSGRRRRRRT